MSYLESNKHLINICCLPDSKSYPGYALYLPLLQSRCSNEFLFFNDGKHSCNSCVLVAQSVRLFGTSWTVARQAPLSMEFSRQDYWSGQSFPSPGIHCCCRLGTQSCLTPCNPMDCSMPCLPFPHHLPKFSQVHVHCIGDTIQPFYPLTYSSSSALNLCHPSSGTFPVSRLFTSDDQNTGFNFSISLCNEYLELLSLKIDWFDLLAVRGTLSLLQHQSLKASILWHSAFFKVQLSQSYVTTGKTIAFFDYMDLCWQSNVSAFQHTIYICHGFPAKKQSYSNFMAAVTIHSDFRAQEEEICHYFHISPLCLP